MNLDIQNKKIGSENILVVESREIARTMGKRHTDLLRDIDNYISHMTTPQNTLDADLRSVQNPLDFFILHSYKDKSGKKNKCYLLTEMGCQFVALKNTGVKGTLFAAAFIKEFNRMKQHILEMQTVEWQNNRKQGKTQRREFTDKIQHLVSYAITSGMTEKEANEYYWRFSYMINNALGIKVTKNTRDTLDCKKLRDLDLFEEQEGKIIDNGLARNEPAYKFLPVVEGKIFTILNVLGYTVPTPTTPQLKEYIAKQLTNGSQISQI